LLAALFRPVRVKVRVRVRVSLPDTD